MLRMNKKWLISSVGTVAVAALLAGCQTGQKKDSVAFLERFPTYGMDLEESSASGRGIASAAPLIRVFVNGLASPAAAKEAKAGGEALVSAFMRHADASQLKAVRELRQAGKKLTIEDLERLDVAAQKALINSFMNARSGSMNASFVAETKNLVVASSGKVTYSGKFAGEQGAKRASTGLLDTSGSKTASAGTGAKTARTQEKPIVMGTNRGLPTDIQAKPLDLDIQFNAAAERFATNAEASRALAEVKTLTGEIHEITGVSVVGRNGCDALDESNVMVFRDHLRRVREEVQNPRWKQCGLTTQANVTSWVMIGTQAKELGRSGSMAVQATDELLGCGVGSQRSKPYLRGLASAPADKIPHGVAPTCER